MKRLWTRVMGNVLLRVMVLGVVAGTFAACSTLPAGGPYSDDVRKPSSPTGHEYVLVKLSADTIGLLSIPRIVSLPGTFTDRRPKPELVLGVGDLVTVTIFEASPGGLFLPAQSAGARPGNFIDLPEQGVDQKGNISIPYAGYVRAAGRSVGEIQADIVERLKNRAIDPQVVVSLREQRSTLVTVTGDVNQANRFPLNANGERILDVIARAGGTRGQPTEEYLTLQRGDRRAKVWLNRLVIDSRENIFLRPGDTIVVTRDPPKYTAFGAAGQNGLFTFDTETFSLAQAVGKAGGLLDERADPGATFVYRLEERAFLEKLGVDTSLYPPGPIATIYNIDLRDPAGFVLAGKFQMSNRDAIFVANAKAVDFIKMITVIQSVTDTVRNVNAAAHEVAIPF